MGAVARISILAAHLGAAKALTNSVPASSHLLRRGFSATRMSAYDFTATDLVSGKEAPLSKYKGKNYKELTDLYDRLSPRGFEVLAFPSNQFGGQEPGTPQEIRKFADGYGAKFPMFGKIDVNGANTHPLYKFLKSGTPFLSDIKWNFGKFLVDKEGKVVERYGPPTSPLSIEPDILRELEK